MKVNTSFYIFFCNFIFNRLTSSNGELTITKSHGVPLISLSSSSTSNLTTSANSINPSHSNHHNNLSPTHHSHTHFSSQQQQQQPPQQQHHIKMSPSSMHSPNDTDNSTNDILDNSPSKYIRYGRHIFEISLD